VIARIIVFTLVTGGVYAILASGFSLIFGVARVSNLAHTAFYMLAAYGMWYFALQLGLGFVPSIILTLVIIPLLGILSYRFLMDRVREHHAALLLLTVALALVIQEGLMIVFGGYFRSVPPLIPGFVMVMGVRVASQNLLSLGIMAVVIVGLWLLLTRTKLGITIRATAQDAEVANLMGIGVSRTLMMTMGIATALAAVAGVVVAPLWSVFPLMWMTPLTMILVIVVLGGLGSIKGSIIGAFIIALVEVLVISFVPQGGFLRTSFALLAMVIVLVVRPGGLFGVVFEEERL